MISLFDWYQKKRGVYHNQTESKKKHSTLTSLHLLVVFGHVIRSNRAQESNVIIWMEFGHLICSGFMRTLNKFNFGIISLISFQNKFGFRNSIHRFPFFGIGHSSTVNYVSYVYGVVSLDVLGHNNNCQCRLWKTEKKEKYFIEKCVKNSENFMDFQ